LDIVKVCSKFERTDKIKYANFYQRHFESLRPKTLLEIGAFEGDSLRIWKEIFPNTRIVGIDFDPSTKEKNPNLNIFIGNQTDRRFLDKVISRIGIPDIVIDDGGHFRSQQTITFKHLFPHLKSGGVYVIEDLETSYLEHYNDKGESAMDMLTRLIYPINFHGDTKSFLGEKLIGGEFNFMYSSITFEEYICLVVKK
jgi:hypothetical protein